MGLSACAPIRPSVRKVFLKYDLQVKGQLGYASLDQLGSVGVSWSQLGLVWDK